ncbi:penicillin binding protein PBP4B [Bacillus sonorensis]|uniref:penicillin binding protein PBP4B n=1 Tax=Bacillus sonorensis TaxID=119858 RepID=UPI001F420967|nr:penicillin binding protein PBP4B [Bacillus sonorensis]MCF7620120.1 penicillin binding protein PBP4B [Bacillus sonorensis]MCY8270678.1 penicillin binding protein PBP4B [Bacillus sonorensis]MCY8606355.1 penicillin binding protein PBP4B [Bacillus sonorensis]MCZ0069911.1 penicillin binding protein PBP4B [Bacillus sonorensis]MCZ0097299.1 penicillin binding protein PBP4B [Bacillus sonorensis]
MNKVVIGAVSALFAVSFLFPSPTSAHTAYTKDRHQQSFPVLKKVKNPEEAGFSSEKLKQVDRLIEQDVASGFPGASLLIIKDGKIVKKEAYGYKQKYNGLHRLKHPKKMKPDTMFDLASNTKMYAVNFALQHLVSCGRLDLNAKVSRYIPEFKDQPEDAIKGKDGLRVIDLLQHTAGFPASWNYYDPETAGKLYSQTRKKTLRFLLKTPLAYEPGTKQIYSDIDYMLLGLIIENITGRRLDSYVEKQFYRPLGLRHTLFNPLQKGFQPSQFAATELMGNTRDGVISFPNIRSYTLQGEVHDEKAFYSMEGISGHAGLFSNTEEMAVLLQVMLNGGGYGSQQLFDKTVISQFTAPSKTDATYGLGWRLNGNPDMEWMFGKHASTRAYGHTGWTGTVTIIDPAYQLGIILLTNKKHSPVIDPAKNPNQFEGDLFSTGKYGSVITGIYEALNHK